MYDFSQFSDEHLNAVWTFSRNEWPPQERRACRREAAERLQFMTEEEKNTIVGLMLREIADEVIAKSS